MLGSPSWGNDQTVRGRVGDKLFKIRCLGYSGGMLPILGAQRTEFSSVSTVYTSFIDVSARLCEAPKNATSSPGPARISKTPTRQVLLL